MKKLITVLLLLLFTFNATSQILVTKNDGKIIVKFPTSGTDKTIEFYTNNTYKTKIPSAKILNSNLTTDCTAKEREVNFGTKEAPNEIKYKFDCTTQTVTLYINEEDSVKEKQVLYLRNDSFVREGIRITYERGNVSVNGENFKSIDFYKDRSSNDLIPLTTINESTFETDCDTAEKSVIIAPASGADPAKTIKYKLDCGNKSVTFYVIQDKSSEILFFDKTTKTFKKSSPNGETTSNTITDKPLEDFPLLTFTQEEKKDFDKRNRLLFIDADPRKMDLGDNSGLKKYRKVSKNKHSNEKEEKETTGIATSTAEPTEIYKHVPANAIPNNGILSIVISNYNFINLESLSFEVNGTVYDYDQDIKSFLDARAKAAKVEKETGKSDQANFTSTATANSPLSKKLSEIINTLNSYNAINLNDLQVVIEYKENLRKYYENHISEFGDAELQFKDKIMSWHPKNVSLTPLTIEAPNADEVEIKYTLKYKGANSISKPLGNYHTIGRFSVDYGTGFFISNLKNNEIYTEKVTTNTVEKKYAKIGSDNTSLGLGLNLDLSYRTGSELRPTFNFAVFVPIDEDLTPFVGAGFGFGIYGKNYKVNFSYGLAAGKVNDVKEQYKNVDISTLDLANTELGEKKLKIGNYFGLAISFNVLGK